MDPGSTSLNMHVTIFPKDITVLNAALKLLYEDDTPANIATVSTITTLGIQDTREPPTLIAACPNTAPLFATPSSTTVSTAEEGFGHSFVPKSITEDSDGGYNIGPNRGIYLGSEIIGNTNETKIVIVVVAMNYVSGN
jgi:hypothetical protein